MDIRASRQALGLTQAQLAELLEIPQASLCRIEVGGRRPGPGLQGRLNQLLQTRTLPELPKAWASTMQTVDPTAISVGHSDPWSWLQRNYPAESAALGATPDWVDWLSADSALECLALAQVVQGGAQLYATSPQALGFAPHHLLDRDRQPLGMRRLPCLAYRAELRMLLFPQVTVRVGSYVHRIDAVLLVKKGHRRWWACYEIDGPGHTSVRDDNRTRRIGLPLFRFTEQDVCGMRFLPLLLAKLKSVV